MHDVTNKAFVVIRFLIFVKKNKYQVRKSIITVY